MEWNTDFEEHLTEARRGWTKRTLKAQVLFEQGRYGDAAQELWEVLIEARHAKDRRWECVTLAHQGKVYRHIRNGICKKLLEEAFELSEELDFTPGKLIALGELGETACLWGELDKAVEMLEESLSLVVPERENDRRALLLRLAMVYEGKGETERPRSILEEVLLIDKRLGIDDHEDREHFERLHETTAGVGELPRAAIAS
jgi:tetratricopeptide (TPR) repeat protein